MKFLKHSLRLYTEVAKTGSKIASLHWVIAPTWSNVFDSHQNMLSRRFRRISSTTILRL